MLETVVALGICLGILNIYVLLTFLAVYKK